MDLKSKLEEELKKEGQVTINAETLAKKVVAKDTPEEAGENPDAALDKDTTTKLSARVKNDPMLSSSEAGSVSEVMTQEVVKGSKATDFQNRELFKLVEAEEGDITITADEKKIFLDSMIDNTRFVLPFSLFGGAYTGEFRTRTQAETFAIFRQINQELREAKFTSQLNYSMRLRNMLFACQVKRLGGDCFAELQEPLTPLLRGEDKQEVGWLDQIPLWEKMNDGVVNLMFRELRKFEYKYLTMLENANNQNFWKAELPI